MTFDPNAPELDAEEVQELVDERIENEDLVLFMKGDAQMPQCGYSDRALTLLSKYRDDVVTVDTLQNLDAFRDALDSHSGWETIPQTFVDGEFIGGSDILAELEERDELAEELGVDPSDVEPSDVGSAGSGNVDAPF
ncbi:glutaredoxin family protein [Halovenus marina]|uniref:glutaredoxin family protein n=1 Tax=Halovenus marina TaxID=3396621 RepID=UPI003F54BFEA